MDQEQQEQEQLDISEEVACEFKCPSSVSASNRTVNVCLSSEVLCDGEINCIFNDADELNCKFSLYELKIFL